VTLNGLNPNVTVTEPSDTLDLIDMVRRGIKEGEGKEASPQGTGKAGLEAFSQVKEGVGRVEEGL
jgi:hypothetical protein